jgi:Uncharacterized conserved protein related to pyruvate formate-lyase activating enzyme
MIIDIDAASIQRIKNKQFRDYANIYIDIYQTYMKGVKESGIDIEKNFYHKEYESILYELKRKGATFRNNGKSIFVNKISPACESCQTGMGSATFFISLQCNRNCFYCFNPNQEDYEIYKKQKRDVSGELDQLFDKGYQITHLALSGGEPLLFKDETVDFFRIAKSRSSNTYTRLYTCGDFLEENILERLGNAGLDEIRVSIKMEDPLVKRKILFNKLALARQIIPNVMVEMPVLPGTLEEMKDILQELNDLNISGINLLEFCFSYQNVAEFTKRSYKIKRRPFHVLYDYWYAGALPVSGSELESLWLVEFAIDRGLKLGVHYCSHENKHTGQIFQQNYNRKVEQQYYFSNKDYFFKTAKVFSKDIQRVTNILGNNHYLINTEYGYLEFHPSLIKLLQTIDVEIGISTLVMEERMEGIFLRELKLDFTAPHLFTMNDL